MATSELSILVRVKDEASQMLGKVSGSLKGMEQSFKSLATIGGIGVGAVTLVASKAISDAQEAVKVTNQLEAVLKSTGNAAGLFKNDILDQANALSQMTNFTDDAIVSGQNLLLTFTQIKGPIFQQATSTILDMSAALGQDLKASAIQLGKALNDPIDGVNALRRVGVSFSQDQQDVIKKLVETGQVAEAQKIILKELAVEFGGSAKATADPLTMLKNRLSEISEGIGKALLPRLNELLGKIQPIVEKIIAWVEANPKLTTNILLVTGAISGLLLVVGSIGLVLPSIIAGFKAIGAVISLATSPVGLIILAIIALVAIGVYLYKHWEDIKAKAEQIWGAIKDFFSGIWDSVTEKVKAIWNGITDFFKSVWDTIKDVFKFGIALAVGIVLGVFDAFGIDIIAVFQTIKDFLTVVWEDIKMVFNLAVGFIKDTWTTFWQGLVDFFKPIWDTLKNIISSGWNWIVEKFNAFTEPIRKAWNGLWDGLTSGVTAAWETVKSVIKSSINWIIGKINDVINAINKVAQKGAGVIGFTAPQIGNIPLLADGGIVNKPTLAMIGEAGPEAVIPLSRMSGAGVGGINVNIMGGTYLSESAAGELGDMIINKLRQNMRI